MIMQNVWLSKPDCKWQHLCPHFSLYYVSPIGYYSKLPCRCREDKNDEPVGLEKGKLKYRISLDCFAKTVRVEGVRAWSRLSYMGKAWSLAICVLGLLWEVSTHSWAIILLTFFRSTYNITASIIYPHVGVVVPVSHTYNLNMYRLLGVAPINYMSECIMVLLISYSWGCEQAYLGWAWLAHLTQ